RLSLSLHLARRRSLFHDTAPTEIYTLSLHDALPISHARETFQREFGGRAYDSAEALCADPDVDAVWVATPNPFHAPHTILAAERSEEHTSELQSRRELVCRLLLEKKKYTREIHQHAI